MDVEAALHAAAIIIVIVLIIGDWVPAGEARVPAIYVFGDSTMVNTAMMLGFKKSPPAALSVITAQHEKLGVNYASGGSGILDTTKQNVSISMSEQIKYFRKTVTRLTNAKGSYAAKHFLSKSIFIFSTFNNDHLFGYYAKSGAQNATKNEQFLGMLPGEFVMQLKEIYGVGARKFAIYGTGRVGCPPALRILNASGGCNEDLNGLSETFNKIMGAKLRDLSSECRELKYSYIRSAETFAPLSRNPLKFGFKDTKRACCGGFSLGACNSTATIWSNSPCLVRDWLYASLPGLDGFRPVGV